MRFAELASEMVTDPALLEELNALLAVKMRGGAATSPRWPGLHDFILRELERRRRMSRSPATGRTWRGWIATCARRCCISMPRPLEIMI